MHLNLYRKALNLFPMMVFWNRYICFALFLLLKFFIGDSYNRREGIDTSKFGADPGLPTEEASSDVGISTNSGRVSSRGYRCKK
ncbi:hypothetical protein LOK49_LG10G02641 [Camellia lanceoleosa]|uniref:Uncharacterized protein n=1 Tax=Camellia lanceoleosa TaxID=1840588 RepID=A0ACC0GBS7_9ERIC|nr:hypothetical protein LOK49_LG10G02641 [Camellia lanceoleosa]